MRSPNSIAAGVVHTPCSALLGAAQNGEKKLCEQDVLDLLTGDVSSADVAKEAQKSGISFQVSATVEKEMRNVGGTDELIRVLRALAPPSVAPASPVGAELFIIGTWRKRGSMAAR